MPPAIDRRTLCRGLAAAALLPALPAQARDVVALDWNDLLPEGETGLAAELRGFIDHDSAPLISQQPASTGVRSDWNGQTVELSGFIVPLDYDGTAVTAFILVPYVGACIHVPPPPANQRVFVTTDRPYESEGLFEPVTVTGAFGTTSTSTELAEIGYALTADRIRPYRG